MDKEFREFGEAVIAIMAMAIIFAILLHWAH
jgi:hypothetical protein